MHYDRTMPKVFTHFCFNVSHLFGIIFKLKNSNCRAEMKIPVAERFYLYRVDKMHANDINFNIMQFIEKQYLTCFVRTVLYL